MTKTLLVSEMSDAVYREYYSCLSQAYGLRHTEFVLGTYEEPPEEILIGDMDLPHLRKSYDACTCSICARPILPVEEEASLFETVEEEKGVVLPFFICPPCQ